MNDFYTFFMESWGSVYKTADRRAYFQQLQSANLLPKGSNLRVLSLPAKYDFEKYLARKTNSVVHVFVCEKHLNQLITNIMRFHRLESGNVVPYVPIDVQKYRAKKPLIKCIRSLTVEQALNRVDNLRFVRIDPETDFNAPITQRTYSMPDQFDIVDLDYCGYMITSNIETAKLAVDQLKMHGLLFCTFAINLKRASLISSIPISPSELKRRYGFDRRKLKNIEDEFSRGFATKSSENFGHSSAADHAKYLDISNSYTAFLMDTLNINPLYTNAYKGTGYVTEMYRSVFQKVESHNVYDFLRTMKG